MSTELKEAHSKMTIYAAFNDLTNLLPCEKHAFLANQLVEEQTYQQ